MDGRWQDLESFVAISEDADARRIFLRMSALSQAGRLPRFIDEIARDADLDDETKGQLTELAQDSGFLLTVEDYLVRTTRFH